METNLEQTIPPIQPQHHPHIRHLPLNHLIQRLKHPSRTSSKTFWIRRTSQLREYPRSLFWDYGDNTMLDLQMLHEPIQPHPNIKKQLLLLYLRLAQPFANKIRSWINERGESEFNIRYCSF